MAPINCASKKAGTDCRSIPANESVKLLAIVIAGFAKAVEGVKMIAAKIKSGTKNFIFSDLFKFAKMIQSKPAVAKISDINRFVPDLKFCELCVAPSVNR